jgi:hypothetical protein
MMPFREEVVRCRVSVVSQPRRYARSQGTGLLAISKTIEAQSSILHKV